MPFDEGFLARWSRRKPQHRSRPNSVSSHDPAPDGSPAQASSDAPATGFDFASLEFSSDFSRFVCHGVNAAVQTAALRRLWVTSPLFSSSDGLDVYRADYAHASPLGDIREATSRVLQMVASEESTADGTTNPLGDTSSQQTDIDSEEEEHEALAVQAEVRL